MSLTGGEKIHWTLFTKGEGRGARVRVLGGNRRGVRDGGKEEAGPLERKNSENGQPILRNLIIGHYVAYVDEEVDRGRSLYPMLGRRMVEENNCSAMTSNDWLGTRLGLPYISV